MTGIQTLDNLYSLKEVDSQDIQGKAVSFKQKRIRQGQTRICMVEVSCIITLIPHSQDPIDVYCSILENSVMYHHIVTTVILSKEYK